MLMTTALLGVPFCRRCQACANRVHLTEGLVDEPSATSYAALVSLSRQEGVNASGIASGVVTGHGISLLSAMVSVSEKCDEENGDETSDGCSAVAENAAERDDDPVVEKGTCVCRPLTSSKDGDCADAVSHL